MTISMTLMLMVALVAVAATAILGVALRRTRHELARTRSRMERLDAIADEIAAREFEAPAAENPARSQEPEESREPLEEPSEPAEATMSGEFTAIRDTGDFPPAGLERQTDPGLVEEAEEEEDDFAAPRMAPAENITRRQQPGREYHRTPVCTPSSFAPRPKDSLVAVGSIQVRSDEVSRGEEQ